MGTLTSSSSLICFLTGNPNSRAPCTLNDVSTSTSWATFTIGVAAPTAAASGSAITIISTSSSDITTTDTTQRESLITNSRSATSSNPTTVIVSTITSYPGQCTDPAAEQSSQTTGSKHAISTTTLAGATVGAFIAGVLLVTAIALLCLRRRKYNHQPLAYHGYPGTTKTSLDSDKSTPTTPLTSTKAPAVSSTPVSSGISLLPYLPEPATDNALRRSLQLVMDSIQSHVEWYYQDTHVDIDMTLSTELSRFETNQLSSPLQSCFELTNKPTVLIKHCLMFHTLNHTVAPGEGITPILPNEIASVIGALHTQTLSPDATPDQVQAFALYKSLTTYLIPTLASPHHQSVAPSPTVQKAARFAAEFTDVFAPWASPMANTEQRAQNLSEVIQEAVRTATWLFGLPDTLRFDWALPSEVNRSRRGRGECVVVSPQVGKVVAGGTRLASEERLLSAMVKRM